MGKEEQKRTENRRNGERPRKVTDGRRLPYTSLGIELRSHIIEIVRNIFRQMNIIPRVIPAENL